MSTTLFRKPHAFCDWGQKVEGVFRAMLEPIGCVVSRNQKGDLIQFHVVHNYRTNGRVCSGQSWRLEQTETEWMNLPDRDPFRYAEIYSQQIFGSVFEQAKRAYLDSMLELCGTSGG
jgi:hypothetical protein